MIKILSFVFICYLNFSASLKLDKKISRKCGGTIEVPPVVVNVTNSSEIRSAQEIECESIKDLEWNESTQGCYIVLQHTGNGDNYSKYKIPARKPWGKSDTDIVTVWKRIRYDIKTGKVNTSDFFYSTSTGYNGHHKTNRVPYGRALDCEAPNSQTGTGRIDLRGTVFAINDTFGHSGFVSNGHVVFSNNNQVADIWGGGYCGWTAPSSVFLDENKVNFGGGWDLQLKIIK